jgi:hypothetical protein
MCGKVTKILEACFQNKKQKNETAFFIKNEQEGRGRGTVGKMMVKRQNNETEH